MSRTFQLFLTIVLLINVSNACEKDHPIQPKQYYWNNVYGPKLWTHPYNYDYHTYQPLISFSGGDYEDRTASHKLESNIDPFSYYFKSGQEEQEAETRVVGRFGYTALGSSLLNNALFNNRFSTFRPLASLSNLFPISLNPNYANPLSNYISCTSPNGESGICASGATCSVFGGKTSGSCSLGNVCCVNVKSACSSTISLNNTYWQSPTTGVSSSSTCVLTVKLDTKLVEQKRPICQIRLDFITFTIAQPTLGTCSDTFRIGGDITNNVPPICGDNNGQHMYLEVPSSAVTPTDVQLIFNFGSASTSRSWNIKVAMLPCGASYLAPQNCLQYFTAGSGQVSSFNWQNVAVSGTRQLNSQDYNICFRTELVNNQRANQLCLSVCSPTVGNAFFLSPVTTANTPVSGASCSNDFLLFPNGASGTFSADRFCGDAFSPITTSGTTGSVQVCSSVKPFKILYKTDSSEATTETNNQGFCLTFQES